jgi:hypothetical protein
MSVVRPLPPAAEIRDMIDNLGMPRGWFITAAFIIIMVVFIRAIIHSRMTFQ